MMKQHFIIILLVITSIPLLFLPLIFYIALNEQPSEPEPNYALRESFAEIGGTIKLQGEVFLDKRCETSVVRRIRDSEGIEIDFKFEVFDPNVDEDYLVTVQKIDIPQTANIGEALVRHTYQWQCNILQRIMSPRRKELPILRFNIIEGDN